MRFFIGLSVLLLFLVAAATCTPSIQAPETTATGVSASSGTRRLGGNNDAAVVVGAAGVSRSLQATVRFSFIYFIF